MNNSKYHQVSATEKVMKKDETSTYIMWMLGSLPFMGLLAISYKMLFAAY